MTDKRIEAAFDRMRETIGCTTPCAPDIRANHECDCYWDTVAILSAAHAADAAEAREMVERLRAFGRSTSWTGDGLPFVAADLIVRLAGIKEDGNG